MFDWFRRLFGLPPGVPRVATDTSPRKMYSVMRHDAFQRRRVDCGPDAPSPDSTPAFALLMEMGYPGLTLTVAAFAGGATSLYMSNAFFVVGGEFHENVLRANTKFIETANRLLEHFEPHESFPIPETWGIAFYALTDTGILGADVAITDLNNDRHALSPLFRVGQEVFQQLLLLAKAKETEELLEMISAYDSAIAARPGDANLYCERAEVFSQLQKFDRAVADYDRAVSLKPNDPGLMIGRGYLHASMGDSTSALVDFDRAIALEPRNAMAYSNRGASYSKTGNVPRALEDYGLAIQYEPRYANSYANRAYAYYKLGMYEKGIADCDQALALRPDHANTYNNRGHCRAALGDDHGASADFQMALRLADCSREVIEEALDGLEAVARNMSDR
jgi:tetratricopeptide (TPR) repeat protein